MDDKIWYYIENNKQIGPVSAKTIQEMYDASVLNADSYLWTEGNDDWLHLKGFEEFKTNLKTNAPPPFHLEKPSLNVTNLITTSGPQIRPWVRYFARFIDIILFSLFIGTVLGILSFLISKPLNLPSLFDLDETLLGIILLFVMVFLEPILLATWGTTPGKALLCVSLRTNQGKKLTYSEGLNRSFSIWAKGLGIGIPLISMIALIISYSQLTKHKITTWDKYGNYVVTHRKINALRIIICILILVGLYFIIFLGIVSQNY
jgi:uncharacterized RDD family membrane protein YckC